LSHPFSFLSGLASADHKDAVALQLRCSCVGNWPRQGLWTIGSEMMENGLNFTDFDSPWDSPIMAMSEFDKNVLEPVSRSINDLSNAIGIDMDVVMMSMMKQIEINGESAMETVEDLTWALAKITGSPAHAEFYKKSMESITGEGGIFHQYDILMYGENMTAFDRWSGFEEVSHWIEFYGTNCVDEFSNPVVCDNISWDEAIGELFGKFMTKQINREAITEFITFFRTFMIDFFRVADHEKMVFEGLKWVKPILRSDLWENLDDLLADDDFEEAVKRFEGMVWMLSNEMHWENKEDMASLMMDQMSEKKAIDGAKDRKRRESEDFPSLTNIIGMQFEEVLNEVLDFLPSEIQDQLFPLISQYKESPLYQVQEDIMNMNVTNLEPAIEGLVGSAIAALMETGNSETENFEEPIKNYMEAQDALANNTEFQQLSTYRVSRQLLGTLKSLV